MWVTGQRDRIAQLERELAEARESCLGLYSQIGAAHSELTQLRIDRDEWKRKAIVAESQAAGLATQLTGWNELRRRLDKAEAAYAEMRAALEKLHDLACKCCPCVTIVGDAAMRASVWVYPTDLHAAVLRALASDAGKGLVSPEEHGRFKEWARKALDLFSWQPPQDFHVDGKSYWNSACALLAEAEELGLR